MNLKIIAAVLILVGAVACWLVAMREPEAAENYIELRGVGGTIVSVHEIILKDGTKCVVVMRGGISCDWAR